MAPSYARDGLSDTAYLSDRICFDAILLAAVAYGALFMLYVQLIQVLLSRPKRGKLFWGLVAYSAILFPLLTLGIAGMLKFAEVSYIDNRDYPGGPTKFYFDNFSDRINLLSQVSTSIVPWVGDILMLYRLMVVWNYNWWLLILPGLVYLARFATSIPLLILETETTPDWAGKFAAHGTASYSLCVSFNIIVTILICFRMFMMRKKVESVLGGLNASFYTSIPTMIVESGVVFTVWGIVYIIVRSRGSDVQEIFYQPYVHVLGITRMLIILRMAQNRAWNKDIVTASARGVLDWQVSSSHSIPLHDVPPASVSVANVKLPQKYREDTSSL